MEEINENIKLELKKFKNFEKQKAQLENHLEAQKELKDKHLNELQGLSDKNRALICENEKIKVNNENLKIELQALNIRMENDKLNLIKKEKELFEVRKSLNQEKNICNSLRNSITQPNFDNFFNKDNNPQDPSKLQSSKDLSSINFSRQKTQRKILSQNFKFNHTCNSATQICCKASSGDIHISPNCYSCCSNNNNIINKNKIEENVLLGESYISGDDQCLFEEHNKDLISYNSQGNDASSDLEEQAEEPGIINYMQDNLIKSKSEDFKQQNYVISSNSNSISNIQDFLNLKASVKSESLNQIRTEKKLENHFEQTSSICLKRENSNNTPKDNCNNKISNDFKDNNIIQKNLNSNKNSSNTANFVSTAAEDTDQYNTAVSVNSYSNKIKKFEINGNKSNSKKHGLVVDYMKNVLKFFNFFNTFYIFSV